MCTDVVFICRGVLCSTKVHEQAEWIGTLFQSLWLIVVVLFLFVNFRVRGVRSWAPRPLVAMGGGGGGGGGDIENNDGSNELSPRLPKNQKHAYNKAFFIVSGRGGGGEEGGEEGGGEGGAKGGEDGHGSGLWASMVGFRMTTSLRKNPKYLTLATEPWCLSPGTFVVPEEKEGKEGKEACSTNVGEEKEVVAGMGEDVGCKQIDLVL